MVAGEDEPLPRAVPEGEGKHPRQSLDEVGAMLLVEMGDDGRVAGSPHVVALRGQLLAQLGEVVELAVEDADDVAGLVRDRLRAGDEVDYPQAPVAEYAAPEGVHRALVGAAVHERRVHARDEDGVRRAGGSEQPADPAHGASL